MKIKLALLYLVLNFACTPRAFEKPNAAASPSPPSTAEDKQTSFQNELE